MPSTSANLRNCTDCGQVDDHPRESVVILGVDAEIFHHIDCGALRNPPCESCADLVKKSGNKSGEELRKFLRGEK